MNDGVQQVTVIGAGLVGGSIAAAAKAVGVRSVLTDADPEVRLRAAELGLADAMVEDVASAVQDADVIIAAVPAAAVPRVLTEAAKHANPGAILTDAASLKLNLTQAVKLNLRGELGGQVALEVDWVRRFVGGHPMAGSERSGPDAADSKLFQGAAWVLTPTADTDDDVLPRLSAFLRRLGARVVALTPARHDELVAVVSHLPQVAASALALVAADSIDSTGDAVLSVAGGGFRDTTRIAASDPQLWVGILGGNRAAILEALDAYIERLGQLRTTLQQGDEQALARHLGRASDARRRLVPKVSVDMVAEVIVPVDDRPGQLVAVMTALGQTGVNIEDLSMRHSAEGERGVLVVHVAADVADQALLVLHDAGVPAYPGRQIDSAEDADALTDKYPDY